MAASGAKRTFILKPESLHRDILNAPVAGRTGHPAGTLSSEKNDLAKLMEFAAKPASKSVKTPPLKVAKDAV